ncbi:GTP pyrophosphokinase [Clostridium perfringens]|uniref:GTP pyrophosphokinase n=1 Tax=Clostridium perfringens TaxID=1502 RepID=UPI001FAD1AF0|nr:hypothetical protein [Clostridium perfringens]
MKNLEKIKEWHDSNANIFNNLIIKSKLIIEEAINEKGITVNSITGRVKEKESYCKKAFKEKYKNPIEEIKDMAGIRVIAYVNSDVDKICEIIENEFDIDRNNSVDKGKLLGIDKVGYKSVHYIVKLGENRTALTEYSKFKDIFFEIQVRTLLQHAWSEIEHDRNYKFSGELPKDIKREFALLSGTLELVDMHFENISKKIDEYSEEVIEKLEDNNLNSVLIDSTSLSQYLNKVFEEDIEKGIVEEIIYNDTIHNLFEFNVKTIEDLSELLKEKFRFPKNCVVSFNNILNTYMIKKDSDKYFKSNAFKILDSIEVEIYRENGIDIDNIIDKYNIISFDFDELL